MIKILITDTETDEVLVDEAGEAVLGGIITKTETVDDNTTQIDGQIYAHGHTTIGNFMDMGCRIQQTVMKNAMNEAKNKFGDSLSEEEMLSILKDVTSEHEEVANGKN